MKRTKSTEYLCHAVYVTRTATYKYFTVITAFHTLSNSLYKVQILFLVDCSEPHVILHCKLHPELYNKANAYLQVQLSNKTLRHKTILKNLISFWEKNSCLTTTALFGPLILRQIFRTSLHKANIEIKNSLVLA